MWSRGDDEQPVMGGRAARAQRLQLPKRETLSSRSIGVELIFHVLLCMEGRPLCWLSLRRLCPSSATAGVLHKDFAASSLDDVR